MKKNPVRDLALTAMLLAVGLLLPFLTGQLKQLGNMLLPMHLPVLLCGFLCGWRWGGALGLVLPLLRSALFGMPAMFPSAVAMAFELGAYGLLCGWLYKGGGLADIYRALVLALLGGRLVWGAVSLGLYALMGSAFTWELFFAGAFANALPGIAVQLILIPAILTALRRAGLTQRKETDSQA